MTLEESVARLSLSTPLEQISTLLGNPTSQWDVDILQSEEDLSEERARPEGHATIYKYEVPEKLVLFLVRIGDHTAAMSYYFDQPTFRVPILMRRFGELPLVTVFAPVQA